MNPITLPENLFEFGFIDPDQCLGQPRRDERPARDEIDAARLWLLEYTEPLPTIQVAPGSYGLKHVCERAVGRYISNGALIAAAIELGYRWRRGMRKSPNAVFAFRMKVEGKRKRGRPTAPETWYDN